MAYTERYTRQCEEQGLDPKTGTKFTQEQLERAFDKAVERSEETFGDEVGSRHWKDKICAQTPLAEVEVTEAAIIQFTATVPKVVQFADEKLSGYRMLIADGYWIGPAGA